MAETNRKKGLGRGLSHLLGEAEAAYRATETPAAAASAAPGNVLPIEFLRPGRFQPRRHFDETALEELASSIRVHGLLQPILVRPIEGHKDAYEIVAGERRWRAAQRAEQHSVPVIIQALSDSQALEIALIENLHRRDLTVLEESEGYQRLIDEFKHSHDELGRLVGKSRSHVANMLRLLALPDSVKAMMQSGELTAGHARALLTAPDPAALAKNVVARGLSVRETERLASLAKAPPRTGTKALPLGGKKTADLMALERDLSERLGLVVSIESRGTGGSLTVAYKTLDQLDDVIEKLSRNN